MITADCTPGCTVSKARWRASIRGGLSSRSSPVGCGTDGGRSASEADAQACRLTPAQENGAIPTGIPVSPVACNAASSSAGCSPHPATSVSSGSVTSAKTSSPRSHTARSPRNTSHRSRPDVRVIPGDGRRDRTSEPVAELTGHVDHLDRAESERGERLTSRNGTDVIARGLRDELPHAVLNFGCRPRSRAATRVGLGGSVGRRRGIGLGGRGCLSPSLAGSG